MSSDPLLMTSGIPEKETYTALLGSPYFKQLEFESDTFVQVLGNSPVSISRSWPWPFDGFHTWSRQWEYPFCLSHLARWRRTTRASGSPTLVDVGSGLSFLPPYLNERGWRVHCCDNDPNLVPYFRDGGPSSVCHFALSNLTAAGFKDAAFDAVVCLSVLEHVSMQHRREALAELLRVLRPGGQMIVTYDIALDPAPGELSLDDARDIVRFIEESAGIDLAEPRGSLHGLAESPGRFLTTNWVKRENPSLLPWKHSLRHLLGSIVRVRWPSRPFKSLTVFCLAFVKPDRPDIHR
jgi:SAM-dependent methyltransferase